MKTSIKKQQSPFLGKTVTFQTTTTKHLTKNSEWPSGRVAEWSSGRDQRNATSKNHVYMKTALQILNNQVAIIRGNSTSDKISFKDEGQQKLYSNDGLLVYLSQGTNWGACYTSSTFQQLEPLSNTGTYYSSLI